MHTFVLVPLFPTVFVAPRLLSLFLAYRPNSFYHFSDSRSWCMCIQIVWNTSLVSLYHAPHPLGYAATMTHGTHHQLKISASGSNLETLSLIFFTRE